MTVMTLPPPAAEPSDPAATAILPRVEDPHPFAAPESEIEERMAEVEAANLADAEAARAEREAEEAAEAAQQALADAPLVTVEPPPGLNLDLSARDTSGAVSEPLAAVREPVPITALLEEVLMVVQDACSSAGQPVSVAVSDAIRTAQINLPGSSVFTRWCRFFDVPPGGITVTTDVLGSVTEGTVEMSGWTVVLRWSGPAFEESA